MAAHVAGQYDVGHRMRQVFRILLLTAASGLSACASGDNFIARTFLGTGSLINGVSGSWGGAPVVASNSVTVQRVRAGGGAGGVDPIMPEEGNVWPAAEGPRATLANPDEALRGIPTYRPAIGTSGTPPEAPATPRRQPRGSGAAFVPPDGWQPPIQPGTTAVAPVAVSPRQPLPSTTLPTGGVNRTITGGGGAVSTTTGPAGQQGVLLRDGNVQILQEPGRPAQQILTRP